MLRLLPRETQEAQRQLKGYGFTPKSSIKEPVIIGGVVAIVSLLVWITVTELSLQRVPWSQAFAAMLSLAVAIIAYRQWRAARHEISIDKYYDRLEVANKRLECVETNPPTKDDMHVFAELDKLEYVIAKYELGYISPILALRALKNFEGLCTDQPGFREKAAGWVTKAAYRDVTRKVVLAVCAECR